MPADMAPRPDGFTRVFLEASWPIIKEDFYQQLCSQFFDGGLNLESINDGFIYNSHTQGPLPSHNKWFQAHHTS